MLGPNSSWLVTSRLDTTRHVEFNVSIESSVSTSSTRACRQARHGQTAWARRVERVETWRSSGIWALARWRALQHSAFLSIVGIRQLEQYCIHVDESVLKTALVLHWYCVYVASACVAVLSGTDFQVKTSGYFLDKYRFCFVAAVRQDANVLWLCGFKLLFHTRPVCPLECWWKSVLLKYIRFDTLCLFLQPQLLGTAKIQGHTADTSAIRPACIIQGGPKNKLLSNFHEIVLKLANEINLFVKLKYESNTIILSISNKLFCVWPTLWRH